MASTRTPAADSRPASNEVVGHVESVTPFVLTGWAVDIEQPQLAVDLALRIDGEVQLGFRPQSFWPAINEYLGPRGLEPGLVWFELSLPPWVADGQPHQVEVLVARTGLPLTAAATVVQHVERRLDARALLPRSQRPSRAKAPSTPQVSIIVLNRNGAALLEALLSSWQQHDRSPFPVEWIVIDHASTDASLKVLRSWQRRLTLRIVALDSNDSFAASCNRGAGLARSPHLLFLNNDIRWCMDALPTMLASLEQACAVGLKLLKFDPDSALQPTVQHLGVRFKLHGDAYWPYEAGAGDLAVENAYSAQVVPAVTAAVMLCRKQDFETVGGFDTHYFYGFEDVDLNLRLSQHTGRPVLCRNDLVAQHHHGHTRLTGRENPVTQRLAHNEGVIQRRWGAWLKRHAWQSIVHSDGHLCREPLVIAFAAGDLPARRGTPPTPVARRALRLAERVAQAHPRARLLWLPPGPGPHDLRDVHVLVVADPVFDLAPLTQRRADLVVLAWTEGPAAAWSSARAAQRGGWSRFDACLSPAATRVPSWAQVSGLPAFASDDAQPLGPFLGPHPPLRVGVVPASAHPSSHRRAAAAVAALAQQGVLARLHPSAPARVADVLLHMGSSTPAHDGCVNLPASAVLRRGRPDLALIVSAWEHALGPALPAP